MTMLPYMPVDKFATIPIPPGCPEEHSTILHTFLKAKRIVASLKTSRRAIISAALVLLSAISLWPYLRSSPQKSFTIGNQASTTARRSISMAWRSSGATNEALIENLAQNGLISSERVKKAMLGVSH